MLRLLHCSNMKDGISQIERQTREGRAISLDGTGGAALTIAYHDETHSRNGAPVGAVLD
jgi:hypothetical protein